MSNLINSAPSEPKHVSKIVTLDANNSSDSKNVFRLLGSVKICSLTAVIVSATTLNNCTGLYFDFWDGTLASDITKTGGILSGMNVGTTLVKEFDDSIIVTILDNSTGVVSEPTSGKKSFSEFIIGQKFETDSFVRLNYTTTDAPINAQIEVFIEYEKINSGELI